MTDVIRRKIDRARPTQAEGAPGADRGWRLALARAARDAMGLDLEFRSLTIARQSLAEILEQAPDLALIALLDGPRGGLGVIMLGPSVTASFIEKQTLGRLGSQTPPPRRASRIDAAMVAGVIDRALVGLDETLADEADFNWAGGFRYASYLEDARPLGLLLEEDAYRVLSAEVALGGGRWAHGAGVAGVACDRPGRGASGLGHLGRSRGAALHRGAFGPGHAGRLPAGRGDRATDIVVAAGDDACSGRDAGPAQVRAGRHLA